MMRLITYLLLLCSSTALLAQSHTRMVGNKSFELSNHLGNVLEVTTDRKIDKNTEAEIVAFNDYYPYGMLMGGRHEQKKTSNYRYAFQGQEKDDGIKGEGNSYNYTYRMHDSRLGRFFAVDPLTGEYPHYSSYQFSGNKTISFVELEGLEEQEVYDYSQRIENGVSPQDMRRYRSPHPDYAYGDNIFVTEITTDFYGKITENSYTVSSWGHSENYIGSGILIVEVNLKENIYKETVMFRDNIKSIVDERYIPPDTRSEFTKSVEAFEKKFEEASFNWITQEMWVISDLYSIIEGFAGKQKNVHGITYKELSDSESAYKIATGIIGLASFFTGGTGVGPLTDFSREPLEPDLLEIIEKEPIKKR